MRRPAQPGEDARAHPRAGARSARTSPSARPSSSASPARPRRTSTLLLDWLRRGEARPRRLLQVRAGRGRAGQRPRPAPVPDGGQGRALAPLHGRRSRRSAPRSLAAKVGKRAAGDHRRGRRRRSRKGRSQYDAPEIDGAVHVASRRPLRAGRHRHREDRARRRLRSARRRGVARPLRRERPRRRESADPDDRRCALCGEGSPDRPRSAFRPSRPRPAGRGLPHRRAGDPLHPGLRHVAPGGAERAHGVDAARRILDHEGVEAGLARVERRPGDAEIGREAGDEDALEAALLEVALEPGLGLAVGLLEARVAVDPAVVALADDELRMRDLQLLARSSAPRVPCTQWSGHSTWSP